nr:hypothetical protein [Tanacetum cinerariifolium]GEZ26765.1 hypothetical protein [Tanacetum cinerariifolium]
MRGFLWYQGDMKKGKAKVAWDSICKPKEEGGLGNLYRSNGFIHISFMVRFPELFHMQVSMIKSDREDVIMWRDRDDIFSPFFVACAWESIRLRADVVPWYNVIWFSHCILRHAIHLWLVVKKKLKTQDRLRQWDVSPDTNLNLLRCPLCNVVLDSHSHLFFECPYSSQVWSQIRVLIDMNNIAPRIEDVLAFIILISKSKSVVSVISRIFGCYNILFME